MRRVCSFVAIGLSAVLLACTSKPVDSVVIAEEELPAAEGSSLGKAKLSDYGFFAGELRNLTPSAGVVPYSLNSPLFSDYAFKKRFIKVPAGSKIKYHPSDVFEFPEGTVLIKNFYYPGDFRKPEEHLRIIETRLLIKEKSDWKTLPYVWNEAQTDAFLDVAGNNKSVSWTHGDGSVRNLNYSVPNVNQCKGCHLRGDKVSPIGLSARQLNIEYPYRDGVQNQLRYWSERDLLEGLPVGGSLPKLAAYDDPAASVASRARAWLEVNCAHCHRTDGPARNSGLHLLADVTNPAEYGVGKAPVAAGKGTGGRLFSVVPGHPDESILLYRIESDEAGVMMPEIGRKVRHEEGIKLVREWILSMK